MIFNVPGHIQMIRNGLDLRFVDEKGKPLIIIKTESRRIERGVYQIEAERKNPHYPGYAVQRKRGVLAEPDIRIVMDRIWEERCTVPSIVFGEFFRGISITEAGALAEGGYTPVQYEKVFRELNPKWNGWSRWAFKFHVIEVRIR